MFASGLGRTVKLSKQFTKKVQDQGQKHYVFDLAHGSSDVRCSVYGVGVEIGMYTCSHKLVHVSSWPGAYRCQSLTYGCQCTLAYPDSHTSTGTIHWPNTKAFFYTSINGDTPILRFNPRHCQVVTIYTFESLILRDERQPTLEMRACVCLCDLP